MKTTFGFFFGLTVMALVVLMFRSTANQAPKYIAPYVDPCQYLAGVTRHGLDGDHFHARNDPERLKELDELELDQREWRIRKLESCYEKAGLDPSKQSAMLMEQATLNEVQERLK